MEKKLQELKSRLMEINDLECASGVLEWDQQTYMPPGGATARARQLATLRKLAHEKLTDPAIGKLLDSLRSFEKQLPYESDEASLIRIARRTYEKASLVPSALVEAMNKHGAASYQAWTDARPANDFAAMQPYLEKTVDLSRQLANCFPGYEHIADPLIDYDDYGMKASIISALFADLRAQLVPIVQAIAEQPLADDSCLFAGFPEAEQLEFGLDAVKRYGFDLDRGRQDKSPHPFTISFSIGDVRITTRVQEGVLGDALFSSLHEAGHAMYEQGIEPALQGTLLATGTSSGVHESQSRLWENLVGRSWDFWQFYYPKLQELFPGQLGSVSRDTFYRAINKVQPSLIRVDADEVTYNLHVMLRFELELALLDGSLAVRDLPQAWNERHEAYLGITPPDDRNGVLQDVHWYTGQVGGLFQGYTLGNILSAQFYHAALTAHPGIPEQIQQGEFGTLHGWLKENIYQHGAKFTTAELAERITGGPLSIEPYIQYLRDKYGNLYAL